jgi:hypothetical protein
MTGRIAVALVLFGCAVVPAAGGGKPAVSSAVVWQQWTDKHGSSVDLPVSLLASKPDDGRAKFVSSDGLVTVYLSTETEARPEFPGHDPEKDMNLQRSDCDAWPAAYYVLKENLAAYSCVRHGVVAYYIAKYNGSGNATLYAEYPVAQRPTWDKIIGRMARSLRQVQRRVGN